ncbi:hypothetical protein [Murimonas intestini]|uniref:hypothetical protein n=1 Tax=Murimonas intestini TaxID=1337051 RepID=UPI0011DE3032|nr:hypothetical protein [Murimonas intestini]
MNSIEKWHTCFDGISIQCEEKWARIKCDKSLKDYLIKPGNGSKQLAGYILKYYEMSEGKHLKIGLHSLAIEILAHAYTDLFCNAAKGLKAVLPSGLYDELDKVLEKLLIHTEIIDCGEKDVDSNRFIWDGLEPFHQLIYGFLNNLA